LLFVVPAVKGRKLSPKISLVEFLDDALHPREPLIINVGDRLGPSHDMVDAGDVGLEGWVAAAEEAVLLTDVSLVTP
jgi:hypothetical protein